MKLSVYYIVKNEIRTLPLSLSHTLKIADEITVLDTGSTDGTWEYLAWLKDKDNCLVQSYVKKEYDASEARNAALRICTGNWILALDADEFIDKNLANKIKHRISENKDADSFEFQVFNFLASPFDVQNPPHLNGFIVRMFKNNQGFHYKNCIHPELMGYKNTKSIDIPINHLQYMERDNIIEKTEFRIKQMRKKIKLEGWNFLNYVHFADIFRRRAIWKGDKKDIVKAIHYLEKALQIEKVQRVEQIVNQLKFQLAGMEGNNAKQNTKNNKYRNRKQRRLQSHSRS